MTDSAPIRTAARPTEDLLQRKKKAWEDFFDHGIEPSPDIIPPAVLDSWKRSLSYGLNPRGITPKYDSPDEFRRRFARMRDVVNASTLLFETLVRESGSGRVSIELYDNELVLLHIFGDSEHIRKVHNPYMKPGLYRGENYAGTTSMVFVMKDRKPYRLVGQEHFGAGLDTRICTAVPICGNNGEILAIVNLAERVGAVEDGDFTMVTLLALAKGVEYNLQQIQIRRDLLDANAFNQVVVNELASGVMHLLPDGSIRQSNKTLDVQLYPSGGSAQGRSIRDVLGEDNPVTRMLEERNFSVAREALLTVGGQPKRCSIMLHPIYSASNDYRGAVAVLNFLPDIQGAVESRSGWNAIFTLESIVGENRLFRRAVEIARQTATISANTLIEGESGTGKEVFAQAIHNASAYRNGPFVSINCASIPASLFESELFGYEGGAFTGAGKKGQPGKFELANGGTIFMDEINSLPLDMQAKVLRVLQDKRVTRVGGTNSKRLDLKIIAASNADLFSLVKKGMFRDDLFYRINVIKIDIPPLRERKDDIPLLVEYTLKRPGSYHAGAVFSQDAMDELCRYDWPGNIRELENVIERSLINMTIRGDTIVRADDIAILQPSNTPRPTEEQDTLRRRTPGRRHLTSEEVQSALMATQGNISKAALKLGISRNTLYKFIRENNITI